MVKSQIKSVCACVCVCGGGGSGFCYSFLFAQLTTDLSQPTTLLNSEEAMTFSELENNVQRGVNGQVDQCKLAPACIKQIKD